MKAADLRKLTPEELDARVAEARRALFDLRVQRATGQLENLAAVRAARRDLARALGVRSQGSSAA